MPKKNRIWISIVGALMMLALAINDLIKFGLSVTTISTFVLLAFFIYEIYMAIKHPKELAARIQRRARKPRKQ
ncbi:hypothetical protein [Lacticaseibacillus zhaodongensis]|uniref:hypothetical protein n=1 Tax=Lacticaseibacillus zhaodongensis TaxID=2668065 RepID=UPI0012D366F1|nr:hypothetical protein [Lacticaseibacillus zhaodongensis]